MGALPLFYLIVFFMLMQMSHITRTVLTKAVLILTVALLTASCGNGGGNNDAGNKAKADDSLAVCVAVYPSLDALPLMLGNDWGILDSLGVAVKFQVYRSQLDAEKALAEGCVDVAMTDLFRVVWWQWQKKPVKFAFVTRRNMGVVANKALRITDVRRLDDRMIAVSRFSLDDYFCDKIESANKKGQILRPQINSVELRAKMLESGQLDAAVLGQQQVYNVAQQKFDPLKFDAGISDGFAGFAFNVNSMASKLKRKQMGKLCEAYNLSVNRIMKMPKLQDVDDNTAKALFLDSETIGRIDPKKDFMLARKAGRPFVDKAVEWLTSRCAVGQGLRGDTVVVE